MSTRILGSLVGSLASLAIGSMSMNVSAAQIDLLVLYDDYSGSRLRGEPSVVMKSWQNQINTMYKNSGVDLQLRIVGVKSYNIGGSNMNGVLTSMRRDSKVAQMRNEVGADFVTQLHKSGNCGIGWMAVDANYAMNVLGASCGPAALIHELGHNMGLNHSRAQGDSGGALYKYALGHGVNGSFGTLMTYEWYYRASKVSVFSNPRNQCKGMPCGVAEGNGNQADAAKALNNVKSRLANFKPTKVANNGGEAPATNPSTPATNPTTPNNNSGTNTTAGTFLIKSSSSGRCLDLYPSNWGFNDVVQWSCTQGQNQKWVISQKGDGYATLKGAASGACLNVVYSNTRSGANVIQWQCSDRDSQDWKLEKTGNQYQITARHSGLCLDAGANTNGNSLKQVTCNGSASQKFALTSI